MLDFYNDLGRAVRGRLDGAETMARVNDALRDVFDCFVIAECFVIEDNEEGTCVVPVLRHVPALPLEERVPELTTHMAVVSGTPPLRTFHVSETADNERYVALVPIT